jgi:hypothetical protein
LCVIDDSGFIPMMKITCEDKSIMVSDGGDGRYPFLIPVNNEQEAFIGREGVKKTMFTQRSYTVRKTLRSD